MKIILFLLTLLAAALPLAAQKKPAANAAQSIPVYQEYGKLDTADLKLNDCEFEKGADAEVLFDKGINDQGFLTRHIRIKIFSTAGLKYSNIRMRYNSYDNEVDGLKAETINLNDGKIEIIPVDKNQVYIQKIDRYNSEFTFAFPKVKPGSIIEYKFHVRSQLSWYFQSSLPTRYSEIQVSFFGGTTVRYIPHIFQPFAKSIGDANDIFQDKVIYNIPSLPDEPFAGAKQDNLERMEYIPTFNTISSWETIADLLLKYNEFGGQFNSSLTDEALIIKKAKSLRSVDEKIFFIFNSVKDRMKWNDVTSFATKDGTSDAWDKKTGNSAEINIILYHLLKKAGVDANPMIISTKDNGKINPYNVNAFSFNNVVVYIPIDTTNADDRKFYVLDATSKFNMFNHIPQDDLNTFGLAMNRSAGYYKMIFLEDKHPVTQSIFLNVEIQPTGKMTGAAQLGVEGYYKRDIVSKYKTDGEKKFISYLANDDDNLKLSSLLMENMETDSLPLKLSFDFTYDLAGSDDNYIYFNSNFFFTPRTNPFLSEKRYADIDFGYHKKLLVNGIFKIPAGYKIDALPKSTSMTMPDSSIVFNRTVHEQDGVIVLHYAVNYMKTLFFKENYPDLHDFFKKMYEMLNEQIVLKKS